ncbi:hypothetical protein PYH69_13425 [Mammaliicoccus lentus]|uniref:Uncharacterized protein n=1 Tax=Mammaliicoccus lentus TaxID=42858 RepID=A0AAX3W2U6_MAMLE|nr:hypothetical protein [Mammaliicoccus lentus]WHI59697.1 hypothetical protein PYH69_13425 [Mammaliicoccus lentus]
MIKLIDNVLQSTASILLLLLLSRFIIYSSNNLFNTHISWFYLEKLPYSFVVVTVLFIICTVFHSVIEENVQKEKNR